MGAHVGERNNTSTRIQQPDMAGRTRKRMDSKHTNTTRMEHILAKNTRRRGRKMKTEQEIRKELEQFNKAISDWHKDPDFEFTFSDARVEGFRNALMWILEENKQ